MTPTEALRKLVDAIDARKAIKAAILRERSALAVRSEREEADWRFDAALKQAREALAALDREGAGEKPPVDYMEYALNLCRARGNVMGNKAIIKETYEVYDAAPPPPRDAGREWQPIETAPKDEYVLVSCGPGGMIEACQPTEFVGKQYTWIDSYGNPVVGPEHWMPLPVPPRALAGGGT